MLFASFLLLASQFFRDIAYLALPSKSCSNLERIAVACIRLVASGAVKGAVCSIVRSARTAAGCLPASGLGAFRRCANTYSMSESIRESPAGGLELGCLGTAAVRLAAEWAPEAAGRAVRAASGCGAAGLTGCFAAG